MSKAMRMTRVKDWFEFYGIACPICGHVGGCMQHKNGEVVACIRITSERSSVKILHYLPILII